jgi:hypothetical protein
MTLHCPLSRSGCKFPNEICFYQTPSELQIDLNRFQRVQLDNTTSNLITISPWEKVKHGVPQGSVLGTISFRLYRNDLPRAIVQNATPILFDDDTSVIHTKRDARKLQDGLNTSFYQISEWFHLNFLSLNISKTFYSIFQ